MTAVLLLGFFLGIQHALEADHVAAVASLASQGRGRRNLLRHGMVWGLGHMLTLSAFAGAVVLAGGQIDDRLAAWLELMVGATLILLGAHVLYRMISDRVHFHVHSHVDGRIHLHAHSHRGEDVPHAHSPHDHAHSASFPLRSLFVGMAHGLAGSAALAVLAATTLGTVWQGLAYVLLFGLGSLAGMAGLSVAIAIPLSFSGGLLTRVDRLVRSGVGVTTIALGCLIVVEQARVAGVL